MNVCRKRGHLWPYKPGMFSDQQAIPGTDVCQRCGLTRIIKENGSRQYIYPKADA
jgi:hypothetical protein